MLGAFRNDAPAGVSAKASETRYYVGVDLGQSRDPTPIAVVRRVDPPRPVPEKEKPKWIFYSKPLPAPRNPLILLRRVRNLTLT